MTARRPVRTTHTLTPTVRMLAQSCSDKLGKVFSEDTRRSGTSCGGVTLGIRKTVRGPSRQGRPSPQDGTAWSSAQIGVSYKAAHISLAIK
jgi:hypothetical protein